VFALLFLLFAKLQRWVQLNSLKNWSMEIFQIRTFTNIGTLHLSILSLKMTA
jgi:hypothetical protein